MGGSTKVVPTTQNTQQTVEIPQYIKDAGMAATAKAQDYASKPYEAFGGEQVASLGTNQRGAIDLAQSGTGAGRADLSHARDYLGLAGSNYNTGTGYLGQGGADLNTGRGVLGQVQSNLNTGQRVLGQARSDLAPGRAALGTASGLATDYKNAGMADADYAGTLAHLAGVTANDNTGAGMSDLSQARGFNSQSAAPVSSSDILHYFSPYVQTALDPVIANLTRSSGATDAGIRSKAGMTGSFGGSRSTLQQGQNNADLLRQISTTAGQGYSDAYDKSLSAAQADKARQAAAAGTSLNIGQGANTFANDSGSRLINASGANTAAGMAKSSLSDASLARFLSLINPSVAMSNADTGIAGGYRDFATAGQNLAGSYRDFATSDQNLASGYRDMGGAQRDLASSSQSLAGADSQLTTDAINRLLTTGGLEQTQRQNEDNAAYQQYQNQQDYALKQLNALIAAAGGVPYGTSTDSKTQGTQVVQTPSMWGQVIGAAGAAAAAASNRDWKEGFEDVDDEDILAKFRGLPVERYRYKPEFRDVIGDDGRERVGPMAGDWAKQFGGNGKIIPMPEIMGSLVSAVRALERRTAPATRGALAA